jgi:DNA invertase Pin-like site-specific DNA recombinase
MNDLATPFKIQPQHLDRLAVVYVRQSGPQQHVRHPESARVQRRLQERIAKWGWPSDRIHVLEGDLGKTGTTTVGRDDFAWLMSEISLGHLGLLAGFQLDRLAREDEAICRLIKMCALFDTLIADEDGLYHPEDFNDRLILAIKGLVGGVELHHIQQRMQQGRLERARRGEWLGATPMGYVLGEDRKLVLDPDEQVRQAVQQVFQQFERLGSISGLLRYFHQHDLRLPVRIQAGTSRGKIEWRRAHRATVRNLLRNPAFAGAFTWGRRATDSRRAVPGRRGTGRRELRPENCRIFLQENHPAYISWDQFQRNKQRMTLHRRHGPQPSAKREVASLLAGRVVCGRCGSRLQTHYSPRLRYACARRALDYGEAACASLTGEELERLVSQQILVALEPASLELSVAACQRMESQRVELDRQWRLHLERAQQDAARAYRQYNAVEPENRLVARSLERQWEEAMQAERRLRENYDRFRAERATTISQAERRSILALSRDLPRLWGLASVAEKRRVVQLLLEKTVVTSSDDELLEVALHWTGGTVTHHAVTRRVKRWSALSNYEAILAEVNKLVSRGMSSDEIARRLNRRGYRTCRSAEFTAANIRQLRSRKAALPTKR